MTHKKTTLTRWKESLNIQTQGISLSKVHHRLPIQKKGKTFSLPSSWRAKNELIDKFDSVDRPEHKFDSDGVEQWYILNFPISDRGYKNNQHHSGGVDYNIKTQ